ncbi:LysM peptidoglycan-binding domain-containing protein [Psychroserpens sp. MEBiC05023]
MLKNFRLIVTVFVVAASCVGAVAQTEVYKDVILDGEPAKLNVRTGEIIRINTDAWRKIQDSTKQKTEIQENLIKETYVSKKSDSLKAIVTSKPDTLVQYYKNLHAKASQTTSVNLSKNTETVKEDVTNDVILITPEKVEKATAMVYDTTIDSHSVNNVAYTKSATNFHIVQKGETLFSLAKLYNTTLNELKYANNLETTLIRVGQTLRIANFEDSAKSDVWLVSKGDTLYSIARKNNTSVSALKTLNGLTSNLIVPGQKLLLK